VNEAVRRALLNSEIRGIFEEPVRLMEGRYQGAPFTPGGASRPVLSLSDGHVAGGDLDGDGNGEVVAVLARSDGGSGTFLYLAVMREAGEALENVHTLPLGDRTQVSLLEIRGRTLVAGVLEHAPTDPACCPARRRMRAWESYDGRLREVVGLRGKLVYGHESHELTTCDGETRYWVLDGTEGDLPAVYASLAAGPYDPVFVEVRALLIPERGIGFAEAYEAQARVTNLFRAAREGPGCEEDLQGVNFRAHGVEPFWTVDIRSDGLELRGIDLPTRQFGIETTSESAGLLTWSAAAEDGTVLGIEIRNGRCVDPMSGSVFPLWARVTIEGKTLTGCAFRGAFP
jgi:putative lipoprotein